MRDTFYNSAVFPPRLMMPDRLINTPVEEVFKNPYVPFDQQQNEDYCPYPGIGAHYQACLDVLGCVYGMHEYNYLYVAFADVPAVFALGDYAYDAYEKLETVHPDKTGTCALQIDFQDIYKYVDYFLWKKTQPALANSVRHIRQLNDPFIQEHPLRQRFRTKKEKDALLAHLATLA